MLLIERHAPVVRLSCPKKCEEQDAAKILILKCPEHEGRAYLKVTIFATLPGHNFVNLRPLGSNLTPINSSQLDLSNDV